MSLKSRRFSLDSCVCLDGAGVLGGRRGSSRFSSKKSRHSQSLDDARLEIQELNKSLNSTMSVREQTITEESLERSNELTNNHSFLKRNKSFHKLFPEITEGENPTHWFICALQKEVLYHGKLFVTENHVCFHSTVLLKDTKVVIPTSSVREVKKHNSALSMISIQTADGEKYSFGSLRNRGMCYKLFQSICSHAQGESPNSSPHLSSAENEADPDVVSSYSSLEDSIDNDLSRQNSIILKKRFHQMSSEGPTRSSSTRQSSLTDEDNRAVSWIWRVIDKAAPFLFLRETRNLSALFYIYMILLVLLLLVSGYMGLRIIALEEQLTTLGALTELSLHHREYQET
ncbi:GRAM domain-containing protein 2B-like isoform X2 [Xiphias gladius]|uniref:GRAM domain-containing protein 2B-like isoform X2 n=1 Tax=Xiphias gladius TaxID=8245 RepID=UPI001A980C97|nr:GRAM domain-containing protein 2B-like isoform X2 [Xiphias gladius]